MLLSWELPGNTLKGFITSLLFSLQALFSFWRKPNLDMRISIFQRDVSSSVVCLCLSLGCSQERGICVWAEDPKGRITYMLLGPFLFFLFQDWRCSLNKANHSRKVLHWSICKMSHKLAGYVTAFRIIILVQRLEFSGESFSNVKFPLEFSDFK